MKFTIEKSALLHAVQTVQRFVSPRNPLPILSGILLKLKEDELNLLATDLEIGIKFNLNVNGLENGSIVLPARQFSELVRRLPETSIEITTTGEDYGALIKYGKSEAHLYGFSSDEFPALPAYEGNSFTIKESLFKNMLKKVLFAVGSNENRPIFTGVLMELKEESIFITASDTHRLSMYNCNFADLKDFQCKIQKDVIVPGKTLSEIARLPGGDDRELEVTVSENQIFFSLSDCVSDKRQLSGSRIVIMSRLIEGRYPDLSGAIPVDFKAVAEVCVEDLTEAVERASLLVQETTQVIKLEFLREKLIVSSYTETGCIYEEISSLLEGEEMTIYFNARYLNDLLKVIEHGEVLFYLSGPASGSVVKIKGDDCFKSLILPVQKKE